MKILQSLSVTFDDKVFILFKVKKPPSMFSIDEGGDAIIFYFVKIDFGKKAETTKFG